MEKISTAIILKTGKGWLNKNGEYPVKLRVTFQGRKKFYTLKGESATPEDFEQIMNIKTKKGYKKRREKFLAVQRRADEVIELLPYFSFEEFEAEFNGVKGGNTSIEEYFEHKAKELDKLNKVQTAILYRSTIISLKKFDTKISFQKITPRYLKQYEKWMVDDEGNSYTTVGVYMRNLKHIVNRAIKNKAMRSYPFGSDKDKYQIPASNNTKKALTLTDIEKLVTYKSDSTEEMRSLQYWIFSYLCSGMNMADIANLKHKNLHGNSLQFIRQKTKDTTKTKQIIDVHLVPEAFEIIRKIGNPKEDDNTYIFPILKEGMSAKEVLDTVKQHVKTTNKYLKRISKNIGLEHEITTYWARHSYATVMKRSGASTEFIREALGHQTSQVTQNYLDSFEDEQKAKMANNLLNFKTSNETT